MKSADSFRVGVLRLLSSALQNEAIAKRTRGEIGELTELEMIVVLKREAKKRKESIEIYRSASRAELAENEERELALIKEYLPPEVEIGDIEAVIKKIVASGVTDFPTVMKSAMAEFKGAADGKLVSETVKKVLG